MAQVRDRIRVVAPAEPVAYQLNASYVAGLFDAKGWIGIVPGKSQTGYKLDVAVVYIALHDEDMIKSIRAFFGFGHITSTNKAGKPMWRYTAASRQAYFLATKIGMYTHTKRAAIEKLLHFCVEDERKLVDIKRREDEVIDALKRGVSYGRIKKLYGVPTSTVSRIAKANDLARPEKLPSNLRALSA